MLGSACNPNAIMVELQGKVVANMPDHIIECAKANARELQATCHLTKTTCFAALGQNCAILRMTGCSGQAKP